MATCTVRLVILLGVATAVYCQDSLTAANTEFALNVYKQIGNGENTFFSPLSMSIVLGMLYEGSNTTTRAQLASVGGFGKVRDVASSFRELTSIFNTPSTDYELQAANRVYARKGYDFKPEYLQTIQSQYQSDVIASDFFLNAEGVRRQINKWVESQTNNKIMNLIPQNALKPNTAMVLVNAIYFKGDWLTKFNPKSTTKKPFNLNSRQNVNTDMMFLKAKFRVAYQNGYRVLEMPYKGKEISMVVVLPNDIEGLARVESLMTHQEISDVHRNLARSPLSDAKVTMPKFKIDAKYQMKKHLTQMGLRDLFTSACDLSGMDGTHRLYVSEMFHQAFVDVNEEGSEAAAATGAVVAIKMAVIRPRVIEFKVDRPFMFYIRDNRTGSVLFMGRYVQP